MSFVSPTIITNLNLPNYTAVDVTDGTGHQAGDQNGKSGFVNGFAYIPFYDSSNTNWGLFYSTTGTSWTKTVLGSSSLPSPSITGYAFGSGTYVIVGLGGIIFSSTNGTTWTARTSGTSNKLNSVVFAAGLFVAVGDAGTIVTSPNGTTWSARTSGTSNILTNIAFGNSTFAVPCRLSTLILTSADGITWSSTTTTVEFNAGGDNNFIFANGNFVTTPYHINSQYPTAYSTNGTTWTGNLSPFGVSLIAGKGADFSWIGFLNNLFYGAVQVLDGQEGGTFLSTSSSVSATWSVKISQTPILIYNSLNVGLVPLGINVDFGFYISGSQSIVLVDTQLCMVIVYKSFFV